MADAEETPSQRQARIRREKREAKITAGGAERLDKITRLSGRTTESRVRNESPKPSSTSTSRPQAAAPSPDLANAASPPQMQAQEDYIRQLLRAAPPQPQGQGQQEQGDEMQDPMMKMMNDLLGSIPGGGAPGTGSEGGLPFSADDLAKATGLPPFLTDMFMGKQKAPPTPQQEKAARLWTVVHALFALFASIYVVWVLGRSVEVFGEKAPAPATFQNPFLIFVMGELLVQGSKRVSGGGAGKQGLWMWLEVLKDISRDGCIVVFAMGAASWWKGAS